MIFARRRMLGPRRTLQATVLIVEDNEDNLFTLRQILSSRYS